MIGQKQLILSSQEIKLILAIREWGYGSIVSIRIADNEPKFLDIAYDKDGLKGQKTIKL